MKNIHLTEKRIEFNKDYISDEVEMYTQLYKRFPNLYTMDLEELPDGLEEFFAHKNWNADDNKLEHWKFDKIEQKDKLSVVVYQLQNDVLVYFSFDPKWTMSGGVNLLYSSAKGEAMVKEIKNFILESKNLNKNGTYLVSSHFGSLQFKKVSITREQKNNEYDLYSLYNDDFVKYDELIQQSLQTYQKGIILLHGKPGTGKTNYLKHLIQTTQRDVIFLTSEMVGSLTDPELLNNLLQKKGSVLIIEDADEVIMARENQGNKSAVSTLLNISDGILSQLLNMTVICTFNTDIAKVDSALIRKGRLICKYEFKDLTKEKTSALLGREVKEGMCLTDIMNLESESFVNEKQKIGFKL